MPQATKVSRRIKPNLRDFWFCGKTSGQNQKSKKAQGLG